MKKRAWYLIAILGVALALLGPAAYAHWSGGQSPQGSPAVSSAGGDLAAGPKVGPESGPPILGEPGSTGPNGQAAGNQPAPAGPGGTQQPEKPGPGSQPHNSPPAAGQPGVVKPPGTSGGDQAQVTPAPPPADSGCRVYVAVVGKEKQLLFGPAPVNLSPGQKWGVTALGALRATGLEYGLAYGNKFVNMVGGEANQGMAGWKYKVNDQVPVDAAVDVEVKPGDKIIWWYSENPSSSGPTWAELGR